MQKTSLICVGILLTLMCALRPPALAQSPVKVGSGSFAEYPPLNEAAKPFLTGEASWGDQSQKMTNRIIYVADTTTRAIPTNDWWTDLINSQYSGDLWSLPQYIKAENYGIYVKFPKTWSAQGTELVSTSQVSIKGVDFAPKSAVARRWGDWTIDFVMAESKTKSMAVTEGHGLPYTWVEFTGVVPIIATAQATYFDDSNLAIAFPFTGDHLGINIGGDHYGIFAPNNTQFVLDGTNITVNFAGTQKFLVISVLPTAADLATMHTYAYAVPRDSKVSWNYNETSAELSTTWTLQTENLKGEANLDVIQGWIPHHYKKSNVGFAFNNLTYQTPRGLMKCAAGKSFTMSYGFNGILPNVAAPINTTGANPYSPSLMKEMIDNYSGKTGYGGDTYWGGKDLVYMGQYMMFAKETGNTESYEKLKKGLTTALEDWYTYTPGEPEHYFAYYPNWKSLVGMNASYGSDEFNDHHFHYGYYSYATAMLGIQDHDFLKKYGEMAKMVAKDYANWDRKDTRLPFMRNFDIWEGHSWAGGMGDALNGNGQESSSEAMQSWGGLFLLGSSLNDIEMRNAGIFGYTMESRGTAEYWFDRDHIAANGGKGNYDYTKYTKPYNSNITGRGIGWWTWFSGDPIWMHSIQWLPISPIMKYLYEDQTFAKWDYDTMWKGKQTGGWDDELGNESGIGNVCLSYLQVSSPDTAAVVWDWLKTNNKATATDTYTGGISYYYLQSHRSYGEIQWDKHTNFPTSTIYFNTKTGVTTYVVYNPLNIEQTCTAYNAQGNIIKSFKVPANKMIAYQNDAALTSIEIKSEVTTIAPEGKVQYVAVGYDQYGATMPTTATWSTNGGGTLNATGLFTASTNGNWTIKADFNGKSASKSIRVGATPLLTTIQVTASDVVCEVGQSAQFTAIGFDQYNDPFTFLPTWTVSAGGSINSEGVFTASSFAPVAKVMANYAGKSGEINIDVEYPYANIALGKTAISSSNENAGLVPSNATDGNGATRWASTAVDANSIYVDLQAKFEISKVVLKWEAAYGKSYDIQVSDNGIDWATVYTQPNGGGATETILLSTAARYVKMDGKTRGSAYGYSLFELEVYGKILSGPTPVLTALVVDPSYSMIRQDQSQTLTVKGYDQFGNIMAITPTWSVLGSGAITAQGLYTPSATTSGNVSISAQSGIINGAAVVSVEQIRKISSLTIQPVTSPSSRLSIANGTPFRFTPVAYDQFKLPFASTPTWSISGGGTISQDGFYTPTGTGNYEIYATQGDYKDTAFISIKNLSDVNIAQGKPTTSSSVENANMAATNATDGSATTRWSSKWPTTTEWLYVDLLNTYTLNRIVTNWEGAFAKAYQVQVSDNAIDWATISTKTDGTAGITTITLNNESARFVRLYCPERGLPAYGYSLFELEVYGNSVASTTSLAGIQITPDVATLTVGETHQFVAKTLDQNGNLFAASVEWSVSGGASISSTGLLTASSAGTFQVSATSGIISKSATINIQPAKGMVINNAPVVTIKSPTSTYFLSNSVIDIIAEVVDVDGNLAKVEYFNGATKLGQTLAAPFKLTLSGLDAGNYIITVKATDSNGAVGFENVYFTLYPELKVPTQLAQHSADGLTQEGIAVYPNPSTCGSINVALFAQNNNETAKIKIADMSGRVLYSNAFEVRGSEINTISIPTSFTNGNAGLYIVYIELANRVIKEKVVIK